MKDTTTPSIFRRVLKWIGIILLVLIGLLLIIGLMPASAKGLTSNPKPSTSYADSVARYKEIEQTESGIVNDVSGSHLLTHGDRTPRVVVFVHGITNSPLQWLELGQMLYDQGDNVLISRMPYHGLQSGQVSELKSLTAEDLRDYADQTIDMANGLGDAVVVVGISGGGTIASWMAANRPEVSQAVLLAPFFGIKGVPAFANSFLMNVFGRLPNLVLEKKSEPRREWVYRGEATRGVAAFLKMGHEVVKEAAKGIDPAAKIDVITTAVDDTANNSATAGLLDAWKQAGVDVTSFEFGADQNVPHNSVDPAANENTKQLVYDQILSFLGN